LQSNPEQKLYIIIGAFGSGKSEYSINLASDLKKDCCDVVLVDLDIVNPYFRSRDVKDQFAQIGIEVISPDSGYGHADVPMISPKIMGAIQNNSKTVILDVGGDPSGCRALGRFAEAIGKRGYDMRLVINTRRPFTSSSSEIIQMLSMLEFSSKLKVSRLISNTNLMEFTDESIVLEGLNIIGEAAQLIDLPFDEYCVIEEFQDKIPNNLKGLQKRVLKHYLLKPWEIGKN
jgi:hypothetical protein